MTVDNAGLDYGNGACSKINALTGNLELAISEAFLPSRNHLLTLWNLLSSQTYTHQHPHRSPQPLALPPEPPDPKTSCAASSMIQFGSHLPLQESPSRQQLPLEIPELVRKRNHCYSAAAAPTCTALGAVAAAGIATAPRTEAAMAGIGVRLIWEREWALALRRPRERPWL